MTKTAECANLLHVIKTTSMKRKLSEVYTHVFDFLRNVIEWYLGSRTSRVFRSFNEQTNKKFKEVAEVIKSKIGDMYSEGQVGGLAMISVLGANVEMLRNEVFRQRQQPPLRPEDLGLEDIGKFMRQTLLSDYEEVTFKRKGFEFSCSKRAFLPLSMTCN